MHSAKSVVIEKICKNKQKAMILPFCHQSKNIIYRKTYAYNRLEINLINKLAAIKIRKIMEENFTINKFQVKFRIKYEVLLFQYY